MAIEFADEGKQMPLIHMTADQLDALRSSLAHKIGELERLEAEKQAFVATQNEAIKALREEVHEIAQQIREQEGAGVEDGEDLSVDPNPDANDPS